MLNGKNIEMNTWYDPDEERLVNHPNYNQIKWCYKNKKDRYGDMFVACNGIIITLDSIQSSFSYTQEKKDDDDDFLLSHKPNLVIEDPQGALSLKLDRNDLDSNDLDFDENLLTDIGKSFIAQLLTLTVKSDAIERIEAFPHFPRFLYSKQGYTILSDYTLTHLSEKFKLLKIITSDKNTISSLIWKYADDYIILPSFDNHIGLSDQTENVAPKVGGTILLYKEKYNELFNTNIRRIQVWAKNAHKILWQNENFVCYSIYDHRSKANIINEDICQEIFADDKYIQSIQEIPFQYINSHEYKCGQILNNLFKEYLGDNIIIPYDIEERTKVYSKAFEDLREYMKDNRMMK